MRSPPRPAIENHDLYLNYLRGGPGFGDPLDRDIDAIEKDLNNRSVLPEYAEKVYGAVISAGRQGRLDASMRRRPRPAASRSARSGIARRMPDPRMDEGGARSASSTKHASVQVQHMFATSFGLSATSSRTSSGPSGICPPTGSLPESELGVPSYGSKYRMDLSKLPDVTHRRAGRGMIAQPGSYRTT